LRTHPSTLALVSSFLFGGFIHRFGALGALMMQISIKELLHKVEVISLVVLLSAVLNHIDKKQQLRHS
jgi:uncharacterized membrane protein